MLCDGFLNGVDVDLTAAFLANEIAKKMLDFLNGDTFTRERSVGGDAHERAFKTADIGANFLSEESENGIVEAYLPIERFLFENRHPSFDLRWLHFYGKTTLEAGNQTRFEAFYFTGWPVTGEDDLVASI